MKSLGRNEPCHCGSGKKYKSCHLKKTLSELAIEIPFTHPDKHTIHQTYFVLDNYFKQNKNAGGCHLFSAMMYILLHEQGISSELCTGEVQRPDLKSFDHSWIEINGMVFDIAIQLTLDEKNQSPVYASYEIDNITPSRHNYRYQSIYGLDDIAETILNQSVTEYIDGAPDPYSWSTIVQLGKELGLSLHPSELRLHYVEKNRVLVLP